MKWGTLVIAAADALVDLLCAAGIKFDIKSSGHILDSVVMNFSLHGIVARTASCVRASNTIIKNCDMYGVILENSGKSCHVAANQSREVS